MMAPRYARSPKTRPAACCCRAAALAKRNGGIRPPIRRSFSRYLNVIRFPSCVVASRCNPVLEYAVTGLLAWWRGQPGQVGNEAATAVFRQCRGLGSSPSSFSDCPIGLFRSRSHHCQCQRNVQSRHATMPAHDLRLPIGIPHWHSYFIRSLTRLHPVVRGRPSRVVRASVADTIS